MKKLLSINFFGALALLFSTVGSAATITVTPSATQVNVGDNFALTVSGTGFPDIVGATLKINFNSAAVSILTPTLTNGIVLAAGSPFTGGIVASSPFNSGDIMSILAPPVGTLPSGSFNAFVINFQAIAAGAANIVLFDDQADFSWTDATTFSAVPTTYTQANVNVGVVPLPAGVWLLGTGVAVLAGRRLRARKA